MPWGICTVCSLTFGQCLRSDAKPRSPLSTWHSWSQHCDDSLHLRMRAGRRKIFHVRSVGLKTSPEVFRIRQSGAPSDMTCRVWQHIKMLGYAGSSPQLPLGGASPAGTQSCCEGIQSTWANCLTSLQFQRRMPVNALWPTQGTCTGQSPELVSSRNAKVHPVFDSSPGAQLGILPG